MDYDRKNTKLIGMKLNKNTDADILTFLEGIENVQGYLKELVRKDMAKRKSPEPAKAENNFNATLELFKAINKTAHD
jgi:hypothetical protein